MMHLDGFGLFVKDMPAMIRFYRDVLGFEIKESENTENVYLLKDGTLFLLYGRKDFERMTNRQWVDFLCAQFDISRTSAKEMLHGMMRWKKEDNFKKLFNGGKT